MRHVQVRLEDGEFADFKRRWESAGFESAQVAGRHALLHFDFGPSKKGEGDVPVPFRPYLKKLAEILASGNANAIRAVSENIDVFLDYVRLKQARNKS